MRIGLVGGGRWAAVHRAALVALGTPPVRVLVRTDETARRLREEWKVDVETDATRFFAAGLDAVIVASPNYLHAAHAIAALEAGAHVLVEKPMATTLSDCDGMLEAARAANRKLVVGHEMRVFRLFAAVKAEAARLGRPRHLDLRLWRRPYRSGASGWKQDPSKLGSSILEEPIHYLDLARWYFGEPSSVQAWAVSRRGREDSLEDLDIRLTFAAGASAMVSRSIAGFEHHVSCDMTLEQGSLRAYWHGRSDMEEEPRVGLRVGDANGLRAIDVPQRTGHAFDVPRQTAAFLAAVTGEVPVLAAGEIPVPATAGSMLPAAGEVPVLAAGEIPVPATAGSAVLAAGEVPVLADGADGRAAVALCLAAARSIDEGSRVVDLI